MAAGAGARGEGKPQTVDENVRGLDAAGRRISASTGEADRFVEILLFVAVEGFGDRTRAVASSRGNQRIAKRRQGSAIAAVAGDTDPADGHFADVQRRSTGIATDA